MRRITHELYGISSIALPVLAVIGISIPLLLGSGNLAILGLYFAVPMVAAPIVVRAFGSDRSVLERNDWRVPRVDWRVWSIAFHLLLSGLIALLVITNVRPLAFYAGVALAYVLCFLLITTTPSTRGRHVIALYHLMAIATLVIYSVTLNYEFFVGHGDLTTHVALVSAIVETGRTVSLVPEYEAFQLWHVYAAVSTQLFGDWVAHHTTMYVLSGGVFAAAIGLMYGIARRVYPNETVGLLSCLVLIAFPLYLFYGMYSIPRSVTSILFLALVLTLVDRPTTGMRALTVVFVGAIVVYHPVSIPFVFAILVVLSLIERTIETPVRIVDNYVLSVTALITAVYWLYEAEFIVDRIVDTISVSFFGSTPSSGTPQGVLSSPWAEVANYAAYAFALFFVLVGFLFWQRRMAASDADQTAESDRRLRPSRTVPLVTSLGILTVALVPLAFPGPTLLLDALAGVNISRFGHYSFMFIALIAGYGLYELLDRGGMTVFLALLVLTSGFAVTAVSNDFTASDNPVVERPFYTFYLTENEQASFETIDAGYEGEIGSDRTSCRYMGALHSSSCSVVDAGEDEALFADYDGVLIREGELEDRGRPLQFSEYVEAESIPEDELATRDRVYDSDEVAFYG
ncbi:hypothetical protein [Natrinema soli]|uniref:Uncharacterized protein n=1 Tax=Natrinema soli TaxID=1930624 RepID=A0ABD5SU03_9EURY|nr:hypothetical protein [Natrinema soli]